MGFSIGRRRLDSLPPTISLRDRVGVRVKASVRPSSGNWNPCEGRGDIHPVQHPAPEAPTEGVQRDTSLWQGVGGCAPTYKNLSEWVGPRPLPF